MYTSTFLAFRCHILSRSRYHPSSILSFRARLVPGFKGGHRLSCHAYIFQSCTRALQKSCWVFIIYIIIYIHTIYLYHLGNMFIFFLGLYEGKGDRHMTYYHPRILGNLCLFFKNGVFGTNGDVNIKHWDFTTE